MMENSEEEKQESKEMEEYPVVELEILPEKVICPECGGLTTEGLIFCEKCGGEMEPMEPEEYERLRKEYRHLKESLKAKQNKIF